jgi:hypothetical protein
MSSSLSSFLTQRSLLQSERNKGWASEKPYTLPVQGQIKNFNKSVKQWNSPRLYFQKNVDDGQFYTPPNAQQTQAASVVKSRQNPLGKRYDN